MFDSHCHLDLLSEEERREALAEARRAGVRLFVVPGVDETSSEAVAGLAEREPDVVFCAGFHPELAGSVVGVDVDAVLGRFVVRRRFVGVGEIGLDYHEGKETRSEQLRLFEAQVAFAHARGLPVVLHMRDAWSDGFGVLERYPGLRGVFHCFTGGVAEAERALAMGFHVSFSGILTYPNAWNVREAARVVPLERALLETDTPYLAPVPVRGRPNRPAYIGHLYRFYAELKGVSLPDVIGIQGRTLGNLFKIRVVGER